MLVGWLEQQHLRYRGWSSEEGRLKHGKDGLEGWMGASTGGFDVLTLACKE